MHSRSYGLREHVFQPAHKILQAGLTQAKSQLANSSGAAGLFSSPSSTSLASSSADQVFDAYRDSSMPSSSAHSRTPSRSSRSTGSSSRDHSPGLENAIPLLDVRGQSGRKKRDDDDLAIVFGREKGFTSWFKNGKLGWWFWNTPRGELTMMVIVALLFSGCAVSVTLVNRLVLWTGVFKFPFPIAVTTFQLLISQFLLVVLAGLTRTFSPVFFALGLGCLVAPGRVPNKGKSRANSSSSTSSSSVSIFDFNLRTAKRFLPLAIAYTVKLLLSNISFAYSMLPVYYASRILVLPLTIGLSYLFLKQTQSITTLSSAITISLSLLMVSLLPNLRFIWEGFVAGLFSNLFVALFPVFLSKTLSALHANPVSSQSAQQADIQQYLYTYPSDSNHPQRNIWITLHYTNLLSLIFLAPLVLLTGEFSGIMRNCYFLDVVYFWLLMSLSALAGFFTFVFSAIFITVSSPTAFALLMYPRAALLTVSLATGKVPSWSWVGVLMVGGCLVWWAVGKEGEVGWVGRVLGRERGGVEFDAGEEEGVDEEDERV